MNYDMGNNFVFNVAKDRAPKAVNVMCSRYLKCNQNDT